MGSRRVLVLVPSLALLDQILHDWLKHTNWERPVYKCVCSDPTVEKGADELVMRQSDLDFPVDTDPISVRRFLQADYDGVRVVFSTYHSANIVAEGLKGCEPFDLGVFDEAHKTAGREGAKFSLALKDSGLPIRKRLFVTATPRHYDIRKRDKEGDARLVYSMDVPEAYGPRAYTLSFAEAARESGLSATTRCHLIVTSAMVTGFTHGEVIVAGDTLKPVRLRTRLRYRRQRKPAFPGLSPSIER
jgi:predicted helicase